MRLLNPFELVRYLFEFIFRYIPELTFLSSFLGLVIVYNIGGLDDALKSLYILVPLMVTPILYRLFIENSKVNENFKFNNIKLFNILYFSFFSLSIFILFYYGRVVTYYLLISILGTIILFEICFINNKLIYNYKNYILLQIILISLNLLLGKHFIYPKIFGVDYESHCGYFVSIVQTGFVNQKYLLYNSYPLYHIIVAIQNLFTNIPTYDLGFIINVIGYQTIILTVYLFIKKISNNIRLSLISALFLIFDRFFNYWEFSSISQSFSYIFFALILSIIYLKKYNKFNIVLLISIIALYLTHPIGSFILIINLIIIILVDKLFTKKEYFNIKFISYILMFIIVIFLMNWIYGGITEYLEANLKVIFSIGVKVTQSITLLPTSTQFWNETLIQNFDVTIIFTLFILAMFLILSKKIIRNSIILYLFYITIIFYIWLYFPSFILFGFVKEILFIRRWNLFSTFYIIIFISISIYYLISHIKDNKKIIIILISAIYFFSAISNTYVAEDSPLYKTSKLGTPYILNNEEIISTQFIKSYLFNDFVVTDLQLAYYMNYYDNSYTTNIEALFYRYSSSNIEVNDTSINNLLEYELFRNHAYFLFRLSKNQDYGLIPEYPFLPMKITQDTIQKLDTKDKIFNSQNIVIYKTK